MRTEICQHVRVDEDSALQGGIPKLLPVPLVVAFQPTRALRNNGAGEMNPGLQPSRLTGGSRCQR